MSRRLVLLGVVFALMIAGCAGASGETKQVEVARARGEHDVASSAAAEPAWDSEAFVPALTERLIIRNADLQLVVRDTEVALDEIGALVDELGGYTVTSQLTQFEEGARVDVAVRVPATMLETALARLHDLALEIRYQRVTGEDVTEEYTDLQAQLRYMEATEAQLLTFMEEAEDTEATLAVYGELQQIQIEIERIKGRIQYLEKASAMSSISIELIPDALAQPIGVAGWRPQGTLRQAFQALVRTFQFLVNALIWVIVYILPVALLVFGLPIVLIVWLVRRWRQRRG